MSNLLFRISNPNSIFRMTGLDGGYVELLNTGEMIVSETETFKLNDAARKFFEAVKSLFMTLLNKKFEYVPSEEPAMTAILWRDPSELKPEDAPALLKVWMNCRDMRFQTYLVCKTGLSKDYLANEKIEIIAWTPLPKLEE